MNNQEIENDETELFGQSMDGKSLANKIKDNLQLEIAKLAKEDKEMRNGTDIPHLVAILVGDNGASQVYIRQKQIAAQKVGMKFTLIHLPKNISNEEILKEIQNINENPSIHGCLVQLPLPKHLDKDAIVEAVLPQKDVDCFHPNNIGRMCLNRPWLLPATPYGIKLLLDHYNINTVGKHCVIIGKSLIVGQPLMNLMSLESGARATVTCCDKYTENLSQYIQTADILVVAAGQHHLIQDSKLIKNNAVVIDVGMHRIPDASKKNGYRLEGDVHYEKIKKKCKYITPVPGGVGPMTVAALLLNTWQAFDLQTRIMSSRGGLDMKN